MKTSKLKEIIKTEIMEVLQEDQNIPLNEFAKFKAKGGLLTPLGKKAAPIIQKNSELKGAKLQRSIEADSEVADILSNSNEKIHANQLNKFTNFVKGLEPKELEALIKLDNPIVNKKDKKTATTNPEPTSKSKKSVSTGGTKKSVGASTSKLGGRKYYAAKKSDDNNQEPDGPSNADLRKLAKSGGSMSKDATKKLQQQEKTKKVKEFLKDMKSAGIVDAANRIADKEGYSAAWAIEKPKIDAYIKNLKA
jgi:hypothetical protein